MMDKKRIGALEVSALGLGCMGMTGFYGNADRADCKKIIQMAYEKGISFFDTADSYGFGINEELVGEAIAPFRNKVIIGTKVGVARNPENPSAVSINGKPDYIKNQCHASLKRLKVSCIDLYYLHHLDPNTPIEETMLAMKELVLEGKVRYVGLGEVGSENIRRAHKIHPITAIQAEYSLFFREPETLLIPLCKELGIGLVACAPLCRGLLSGSFMSYKSIPSNDFRRFFPRFSESNLPHNLKLIENLRKVAEAKSCSLSQLALGWISYKSSSIVPIFGTTKSSHVIENIDEVRLSEEDVAAINQLMGDESIHGERLTEAARPFYRTD